MRKDTPWQTRTSTSSPTRRPRRNSSASSAPLESGDLELEQSLESYTRGVALVKSLRERLDHAEQQVKILVKDMDGNDALVAGEAAATENTLSI